MDVSELLQSVHLSDIRHEVSVQEWFSDPITVSANKISGTRQAADRLRPAADSLQCRSPDTGLSVFLYSPEKMLRFFLYLKASGSYEQTVYFRFAFIVLSTYENA